MIIGEAHKGWMYPEYPGVGNRFTEDAILGRCNVIEVRRPI